MNFYTNKLNTNITVSLHRATERVNAVAKTITIIYFAYILQVSRKKSKNDIRIFE